MKQFLLYLTKTEVLVKTKFLVSIFLLGFFSVNAQNSFNSGDGWGAGWGVGAPFSPSAGSSLIYTATNSSGFGERFFRFYGNGTPCGQYGPETVSQQLMTDTPYNNTTLTCGNNTYAYSLNVSNTTDNYVFKSASVSAAKIVIFKIEGAIRTVSAVTQSPLAANVNECHSTTVTATLDGALSAGQAVYLRYTKDGYATSTVVKLIGSGTTYTGIIPSAFNTAGANVSYYLFTSGTTMPDGADADFYTINLNNNGGPNYSYSVAAGGATTYVPDDNFEQALIALGLDCTLDNYVFTSNISDVTILDIRRKGIVSLIGIEGFTSLEELYCNNEDVITSNDNAIATLDVRGFPNLIRLYCQNNQITVLNISGLTKLEALDTSNNPFSSHTLDVHFNPNLYYLVCQGNGLTTLNIDGLTNLETLVVWQNNFVNKSFDLHLYSKLKYLDCDENGFTSININGLTKLETFYCSSNQLTSMDVRGLSNLNIFYCSNNPLLTCILVDDVAAAILKTSTVDPDPQGDGSFLWETDDVSFYSYCKCNLTTTWTSDLGGSWDHGAPIDGTYAAIIAADYSQSANIDACSLTINTNAIVTIPSGFNVTLNAPIIVTSGSFTLENNANLIQTNKNSINAGTINVKRDSSPLFRSDYTMWSSPVSGSQTLGGFSPLTVTNRFHEYDTATDYYKAVPSTDPFGLAKGYLIRMPNTWVDYVVSPPSTPLSWTGTFMGTPNNGNFTYALSTALNGYNAVGNPYPSTLNIDDFINGNTANIDGTLWFWRKTNDALNPVSYSTCTLAGVTSGNTHTYPNDNFISVGQGFIVKAKAGQTTLNFNNTMRVANSTNQFFKTKQIERNRIWLNLSNTATPINQMMVAYMSGATQDIDAAIDGRYFNDSPTALNSLISSEEFAIQGRALPFEGTDIVPLAFKTDVAGAYTITIDHVDGFFSGNQEVFLKDNNTGIETDLKAGAYTFTAAAGVDNARFSLKYQRTLGVNNAVFNDDSITIHKIKGILYVNSGSTVINNIKVFDIQGRLIAEQKNLKSNTATIKDLKATQQVLIVKVTSQDNKVVSKKVVN
jgi:hypothetical protein